MRQYELRRVMEIINGIDGDCYICAGKAAVELAKQFPAYREEIQRLYAAKYGEHTLAEIRREWIGG